MRSMARAPKFSTPQHMPPASGWHAGHRAPGGQGGGLYGQLDGVCLENTVPLDAVSSDEKRAFPGDCPGGSEY